jgi:hypothetical protein
MGGVEVRGNRPRASAANAAAMIVVAAVLGVLGGPLSAPAYSATPLPSAVEENFDSVFAFIEAGGLPNGRERVACDLTCAYLVGRALPPPSPPAGSPANPSALRQIGGKLYRLRTAIGELPGPARFGLAGTLIAANVYVWREVVKDAKRLFVGVELPPRPSSVVTRARWVPEGDLLLTSGSTTPVTRVYAPDHGLLGTNDGGSTVWDDAGTGSCWYYGQIMSPTFGGFGGLSATGACAGGAGSWSVAVAYQSGPSVRVTADPQPTTQPPVNCPPAVRAPTARAPTPRARRRTTHSRTIQPATVR